TSGIVIAITRRGCPCSSRARSVNRTAVARCCARGRDEVSAPGGAARAPSGAPPAASRDRGRPPASPIREFLAQEMKRPRFRGLSPASVLDEEASQLLAAARMPQLAQRLRLDLADALARDVELLADLFERVVGVHVDAEAHAQHL